ncbi:hypothetical protein JIN87_01765 [Pelagicoccus mobilis]|uniref:PKD domain-containing protein n=2 Tax=Pelagicoccus mobilis TaxID=415221 RepID=A0A934VMV3_9BACT|nr:hypothetical protein [Pelagicoccus mobilis]
MLFVALNCLEARSNESENIIDLLVVYTSTFEDWKGNADVVESIIQASIVSANEAFTNSNVDIRLRLRDIKRVDYRHGSDDLSSELDMLTNGTGAFSEVQTWRDETGADLVCLFEAPYRQFQTTIGKAWVLNDEDGNPSRGYSLVVGDYATTGQILQHEIGHNLGGAHEHEDSDSTGLYDDSHAHTFNPLHVQEFAAKTVMYRRPGDAINYFSNPDVEFWGSPSGVASGELAANNARTLNAVSKTVSNYRPYVHPDPISEAGENYFVMDDDGDGLARVRVDGSESWALEGIEEWHWSWEGGTASTESAEFDLPIGVTELTLTVMDTAGVTNSDTIEIEVLELSGAVDAETTESRSFVVHENGIVRARGFGNYPNLGLESGRGILDGEETFVQLRGVERVLSEGVHTIFLMDDGSAYGAGSRSFEGLPGASRYASDTPTKVIPSGVKSAAVGDGYFLFVLDDGSLIGGGERLYSLGDLERFSQGARDVAAGDNSALILMDNGELWCVGEIASLAQNRSPDYGVPLRLFESGVVSISIHYTFATAVMEDGSLWRFQREDITDYDGSDPTNIRFTPEKIFDSGIRSASQWFGHTSVTTEDGGLLALGNRVYPPIGPINPSAVAIDDPVEIARRHVVSSSLARDVLVVIGEDGSAWGSASDYRSAFGSLDVGEERLFVQLAAPVRELDFIAPVAKAGPNIFDVNRDGRNRTYANRRQWLESRFNLSARDSDLDWLVSRWEWNGGDGSGEGLQPMMIFEDGKHTVTLKITDVNGLSSEDTVEITIDTPQTFMEWLKTHYPDYEFTEGQSYYLIDSDHDGLSNEVERILGSDPSQYTQGVLESYRILDGAVHLTFRDGVDVTRFRVETSSDLKSWRRRLPSYTEEMQPTVSFEIEDSVPLFLRIEVQ